LEKKPQFKKPSHELYQRESRIGEMKTDDDRDYTK
jgi:hypothetical protein